MPRASADGITGEKLQLRLPAGIPKPGRWVSIQDGETSKLWTVVEVIREPSEDFIEVTLVPLEP